MSNAREQRFSPPVDAPARGSEEGTEHDTSNSAFVDAAAASVASQHVSQRQPKRRAPTATAIARIDLARDHDAWPNPQELPL